MIGADPPVPLGEAPAPRRDPLFQEPSSSSSGRGFGAGMLVIGFVAGFGGGFLVGQRVAPPAPRPSAAQVPRPAPAPQAPVVPAQNVTEALVAEPPQAVQEPDVQPPIPVQPPLSVTNDSPVARATTSNDPGSLQIASRPTGAQVFVDEVLVGTTPMTLLSVKPGAHRVRIELPGHRPWATSVNVEAGVQARVGASLER